MRDLQQQASVWQSLIRLAAVLQDTFSPGEGFGLTADTVDALALLSKSAAEFALGWIIFSQKQACPAKKSAKSLALFRIAWYTMPCK